MKTFKGSTGLAEKLTELVTVLTDAQKPHIQKNNAFFSNLTEISETLKEMQVQIDKYLAANAVKKKLIASDVRHKLKGLRYSLTFQIRLIDSVYVNPPMLENQFEFDGIKRLMTDPRQTDEAKTIENHIK